jgi:glycosyltransferase involved in cell wall biosynthesis
MSDETIQKPTKAHLRVNHVMSNELKSGIFDDFIGYLREYSNELISHQVSQEPVADADVFHFHRPHLESRLPPRSVVTVHHDLNESDPWLDFLRFATPYKDAARIVCLNTSQQKWLAERGYDRLEVIPHGYNDRFLKPTSRSPNAKIILGLASKRYARRVKGEALFLEIAKRLPAEKFAFILVGAARTQEAAILKEYGFETRVYEHLPYRLFGEFYKEIDGLLILSWHEGGPACIPEAIATATPIISTAVGMALDYVQHRAILTKTQRKSGCLRTTTASLKLCKMAPKISAARHFRGKTWPTATPRSTMRLVRNEL